jgi:hypothetical protein
VVLLGGSSTTTGGGAVSLMAGDSTEAAPYATGGFVLLASGNSPQAAGAVSLVAGESPTESGTAPVAIVGGKTLGATSTAGAWFGFCCGQKSPRAAFVWARAL